MEKANQIKFIDKDDYEVASLWWDDTGLHFEGKATEAARMFLSEISTEYNQMRAALTAVLEMYENG